MPNIEPAYAAQVTYAPDAADRRVPVREEHLTRIAKLMDEGAIVLAGAYDDMSATLLVFDLENEDAVKAIIESDVYWRNGVWTGYEIRKLNRLVEDG